MHPLQAWLDRRKSDVRPAQFARRVGISHAHLTLICKRKRGASAAVAYAIEQETGGEVTVGEIVATPLMPRKYTTAETAA